jgi:hypothetical protein
LSQPEFTTADDRAPTWEAVHLPKQSQEQAGGIRTGLGQSIRKVNAAAQPVGVSKHFSRAEYVEHPHGRHGDDRDASRL